MQRLLCLMDVLRSSQASLIVELLAASKYNEAIQLCRQALAEDPANTDVRILLVQALLSTENIEEVGIEARILRDQAPKQAIAHRLVGEWHAHMNQRDQAEEAFKYALTLDPEDSAAAKRLQQLEHGERIFTQPDVALPNAPQGNTTELSLAEIEVAAAHPTTTELDLDEIEGLAEDRQAQQPTTTHSIPPRRSSPPVTHVTPSPVLEDLSQSTIDTARTIISDDPFDKLGPSPNLSFDDPTTAYTKPLSEDISDTAPGDAPAVTDAQAPRASAPTAPKSAKARPWLNRIRSATLTSKQRKHMLLASLGVVFIGLGGWFVKRYYQGKQFESAIVQTLAKGTFADFQHALSYCHGSERSNPSCHMLSAIAHFEHGYKVTPSIASWSEDPNDAEDKQASPEHMIATTYQALSDANLDLVQQVDAKPWPSDYLNAERLRTQALLARYRKDWQRALTNARAASRKRRQGLRDSLLLARLLSDAGQPDQALSTLRSIKRYQHVSSYTVIYGHVIAHHDDAELIGKAHRALAKLLLSPDSLSPTEQTLAHTAMAILATRQGQLEQARQSAKAAIQVHTQGDFFLTLQLTKTLIDLGNAKEALKLLKALPHNSTELAHEHAPFLAQAYTELGRLSQAQHQLNKAERGTHYDYVKARLHHRQGQYKEATMLYSRVLETKAFGIQAAHHLAKLALAKNQPSEAITRLREAQAQHPGHLPLTLLLIEALQRDQQEEQAEQVLNEALQQYPATLALKVAQAEFVLAKGQASKAAQLLETLAQDHPDNLRIQLARGKLALAQSQFAVAQRAFNQIRAQDPHHIEANTGLLSVYIQQHETAKAQRLAEQLKKQGVKSAAIQSFEAKLLVSKGMGEQAIQALKSIIGQSPDTQTLLLLGRAQVQAEHDKDARQTLEQALERDSNLVLAHLGLATLAIREGYLSQAKKHVDNAAQSVKQSASNNAPLQARVLAAQGRMHFEYGDFGATKNKAEQALKQDAQCAHAHFLLAQIAQEKQQKSESIKHLRSAMQGHAPPPESVALLASLLGKQSEGCRLAQRYLQAAPQGYDAKSMRDLAKQCP